MELPKEFKGEVHFYYWDVTGKVVVSELKYSESNPDYLYLGSKQIEIDFSITKEDAVKRVVNKLQNQKKEIQAKAQSDLNKLDEKINSLLAINYDWGE